MEHPENRKHFLPNGLENIYFTDRVAFKTNLAVALSNRFNTAKRQRLKKKVSEKFSAVFKGIENEFGYDIKFQMVDEMVDRIYYYRITKKYFAKILDKTRPKLIMELCYYLIDNFALSELGKERGIPTIEYAHGFAFPTLTPLQYNPDEKISVLPDVYMTYSESQKDIIHLPDDEKVVAVGFPYFDRERDNYRKKFKREDNTICFISTVGEGKDISLIASEVAKQLGNRYRIIYKLHPKEYAYYKEDYPWLISENIEVIDNNDNHMFKYLAESRVVVSARTSSIWEALGFGCETILLDLGDTKLNMQYLIDNKYVELMENASQVINAIEQGINTEKASCIYMHNSMDNICKYINKMLGDKKDESSSLGTN